jgi:ribosomal-protein-alanine N-acetyltransferase
MITEIINNERANELLKKFNCSINDYKDNPFSHILMYDDKGIIVYTKIYDRVEIEYIIVDKQYRRQGIGKSLLNYIINNNTDTINITLEVKESNIEAIKFYEKCGFEKVAIREKYYGIENGILMIRKFDKNEQ